jgi:cysteinyl-tRNA synthetase
MSSSIRLLLTRPEAVRLGHHCTDSADEHSAAAGRDRAAQVLAISGKRRGRKFASAGHGWRNAAEQLQEKLKQAEGALKFMEQKLQEATEAAKTAEEKANVENDKVKVDAYKAHTDRLRAQWDARIKAAGAIATGAQVDNQAATDEAANQVATDEDMLAEIEGIVQQGAADHANMINEQNSSSLEQKVDALADMVKQLVTTLSPPAGNEAPPQAVPPSEPVGEV